MKVLALIQHPDHPCYRYRIEAFAPAMAERGIELRPVVLRRGLGRIGQLRAAGQADLVILQRRLLPLWQLALLRRHARRLVFDFDDAVYQRDSYSRKGPQSNLRTARFWATAMAADAVIAGNGHLKRSAAAFAEPCRVRTIPTCVDPLRYPLARHVRTGSDARLVWIGQQSTLASLDVAGRCLAAAGARLPGLSMRLICDGAVPLPGVVVELRPWSSDGEAGELADADVGVSWLPDDSWSRGKCGLKVLQYMAAGLPVVANPVAMNRRLVVDGVTGILASTPQGWAAAIARLAADPALRRTMGQAGRRMVERRYSVAGWGPVFADWMLALAGGAPRRRMGGSGVARRRAA